MEHRLSWSYEPLYKVTFCQKKTTNPTATKNQSCKARDTKIERGQNEQREAEKWQQKQTHTDQRETQNNHNVIQNEHKDTKRQQTTQSADPVGGDALIYVCCLTICAQLNPSQTQNVCWINQLKINNKLRFKSLLASVEENNVSFIACMCASCLDSFSYYIRQCAETNCCTWIKRYLCKTVDIFIQDL